MDDEGAPPNKFLVAAGMEGDQPRFSFLRNPGRMTSADAINLAAWLAVMADPTGEEFDRVRRQITGP